MIRRPRHHRPVLVAALVAVSVLVAAPAPAAGPPDLFGPEVGPRGAARGEVRGRTAALAVDLETAPGPLRVTLNLFADRRVPVTLEREMSASGGAVWTGAVPGRPGASVVIVAEDGYVFGNARLGADGEYVLRHGGDGALTIVEIDPAVTPTEVAPQVPPPAPANDLPGVAADLPAATLDTPGGPTIDVMILLSDDVVADHHGGDEAQARVWAAARIADLNAALADSQVVLTVRLTGASSVPYAETGDVLEDLRLLTFTPGEDCSSDDGFQHCDPTGILDEVHTWRDDFGADAVILVVGEIPGNGPVGVAWRNCELAANQASTCRSKYSFAVVEHQAAESHLTLAHEFGHLLGSAHDADNGGDTYARGYRIPGEFATIMAYTCTVVGGTCSPGTDAPRVPYFSNPAVLYGGIPMGKQVGMSGEANNALHFTNVAPLVAAFRSAATCDGALVTIFGSPWADVIHGTGGPDVIMAHDGNDTIHGHAGDDVICAGRGNDIVYGGDGRDRIFGERGHDTLYGEVGNDRIRGGPGNDVIEGGRGHDRLYGNKGDDTLIGQRGNDRLHGGPGYDILRGGPGEDLCATGEDVAGCEL